MKAKRLLFLVMAICLASGVKAQFYDNADEIFYSEICDKMRSNINYYEDQVESANYNVYYDSSKQAYCIEYKYTLGTNLFTGAPHIGYYNYEFTFSSNREYCYLNCKTRDNIGGAFNGSSRRTFKKVSKSFFKSGRSRTPSGTMYE